MIILQRLTDCQIDNLKEIIDSTFYSASHRFFARIGDHRPLCAHTPEI